MKSQFLSRSLTSSKSTTPISWGNAEITYLARTRGIAVNETKTIVARFHMMAYVNFFNVVDTTGCPISLKRELDVNLLKIGFPRATGPEFGFI